MNSPTSLCRLACLALYLGMADSRTLGGDSTLASSSERSAPHASVDHSIQRILLDLTHALANEDRDAIEVSVRSVSAMGNAAVPAIARSLNDESLQSASFYALKRLGAHAAGASSALVELLLHPSLHAKIGFTLQAIGPTCVPLLIAALDSPNRAVRTGATAALTLQGRHCQPALQQLRRLAIADPDHKVRRNSIQAIYSTGNVDSSTIFASLSDRSSIVRLAALSVLAANPRKERRIRERVRDLLHDSDLSVRLAASNVLQLRPDELNELLRE